MKCNKKTKKHGNPWFLLKALKTHRLTQCVFNFQMFYYQVYSKDK